MLKAELLYYSAVCRELALVGEKSASNLVLMNRICCNESVEFVYVICKKLCCWVKSLRRLEQRLLLFLASIVGFVVVAPSVSSSPFFHLADVCNLLVAV